MSTEHTLVVEASQAGIRLDRLLTQQPWAPTRSQLKAAIGRGDVRVNENTCKPSYTTREGDVITVTLRPPIDPTLVAQDIPLTILYEDDDLVVIDKPSGLVVHPAPGHPDGTLVNALLHHCGDRLKDAQSGQPLRPGIVHRLDKDTSGIMVVAKNLRTHAQLAAQFAEHTIERIYMALCHAPSLVDRGRFETLHGRHPNDRKRFTTRVQQGREAITHFEVKQRFTQGAALVVCKLHTGRTHQVRVHLAEHHAPIFADPIYAGRHVKATHLISRLALHAFRLAFTHPDGSRRCYDTPPPDDMTRALEALQQGESWR